MTSEYMDEACEWVGVNYPDLDGEAYDAKLAETIADLEQLNASQPNKPCAATRTKGQALMHLTFATALECGFSCVE